MTKEEGSSVHCHTYRKRIRDVRERRLRDALPARQARPHVQHAGRQWALTRQVKPPLLIRPGDGPRGPRDLRELPPAVGPCRPEGRPVRQRLRECGRRGGLEARRDRETTTGEGIAAAAAAAQVRLGDVREHDAPRDAGRRPGRVRDQPALPEGEVQRRQLCAQLHLVDLDDGRARGRSSWVLQVGGDCV